MAFQEYGKQHEDDFSGSQQEFQIQNKLIQSFGMYRLMGQLVQVYLPKMFKVAVELTKGNVSDEVNKYSDNDPRIK